jgi:hypothetical protein
MKPLTDRTGKICLELKKGRMLAVNSFNFLYFMQQSQRQPLKDKTCTKPTSKFIMKQGAKLG